MWRGVRCPQSLRHDLCVRKCHSVSFLRDHPPRIDRAECDRQHQHSQNAAPIQAPQSPRWLTCPAWGGLYAGRSPGLRMSRPGPWRSARLPGLSGQWHWATSPVTVAGAAVLGRDLANLPCHIPFSPVRRQEPAGPSCALHGPFVKSGLQFAPLPCGNGRGRVADGDGGGRVRSTRRAMSLYAGQIRAKRRLCTSGGQIAVPGGGPARRCTVGEGWSTAQSRALLGRGAAMLPLGYVTLWRQCPRETQAMRWLQPNRRAVGAAQRCAAG